MCKLIKHFLQKVSVEKDKILNINVNLSGRVNPDLGYSYSIFNFDERPLTDVISEKVGGYRVSIDNDTRAMIYGEYMQGVVKGEKNIIFINVSWGLGMGIIIDGKIYKGNPVSLANSGIILDMRMRLSAIVGKRMHRNGSFGGCFASYSVGTY